jgi:hypothetical protein
MPIPGEPDALNGACPVRREAWGDGLLEYRALCLLYSINRLQRTAHSVGLASYPWRFLL